jgi:hypothetical protein
MKASADVRHSNFRLTRQQVQVLKKRQALFLDAAEQIVTLVMGAQSGITRSLVSSHLSPAAFRVLGILLLAAPNVTSYPMLYAGLYCSNECFEALLAMGTLLAAEFQGVVAESSKRLGALSEAEFEQRVQPIRYAVKSVKQVLRHKPFGWIVENHYGQGYLLADVSQS